MATFGDKNGDIWGQKWRHLPTLLVHGGWVVEFEEVLD